MGVETETSPDVERKARNLGWIPKEDFHGDETRWVDAETYVKRGEEILPILRKNNQDLQAKLDAANTETKRLGGMFEAAQEAIESLKEFQSTETKRQVEEARKTLLKELKAAKKDDNTDLEVELEDQIRKLDKGLEEAPPVKKETAPSVPSPVDPNNDPAFVAWRGENTWFDTDPVRRATSIGVAQKLRADGNTLVGKAFYDKVAEEVADLFDKPAGRATSRVEGAGGGGSSGASRAKGYKDLPPDAKAACEKQAAKVVGSGRAFKEMAGWQAHYAKIYFEDGE